MARERERRENQIDTQVENLIDSFTHSTNFRSLAQNSQEAYRIDLSHFLRFAQDQEISRIVELTQKHVSDFASKFNPSTANRRLAALKRFLNWADSNSIEVNPDLFDVSRKEAPVKRPFLTLTEAEVGKLKDAAKNNIRDLALITLALNSEASATEILNLKKSDISVDNEGVVRLRISTSRKLMVLSLEKEPSKVVIDLLNQQIYRKSLFEEQHGNKLTRQGFWHIIKRYGRQIGKPDINPTVLKNTYKARFAKVA